LCRNQRAQHCRRERPMREEQIAPRLLHDPRTSGQGPRTMRDRLEQRMQGTF
jgi:hypothetical protein